ncbi:histidine kinase [Janthinobacterium sp. FT14W]|uniref:histidine kinase n=1 Tax=Janthinobacterium sp. FT14W TaxID=2654253 RepID=UPI001D00BFD8|nr:histidine kinase [Janthinobacterium sp. FT14W]
MVPMTIVVLWRNRQYEALALQLQQDAERDRLARELSESQLRLLRAQIEPHFLFNTLGAVQQLAEHGAHGTAPCACACRIRVQVWAWGRAARPAAAWAWRMCAASVPVQDGAEGGVLAEIVLPMNMEGQAA